MEPIKVKGKGFNSIICKCTATFFIPCFTTSKCPLHHTNTKQPTQPQSQKWNECLKSQKRQYIRIVWKINNSGRIRSIRKIISKHLNKKLWLCKISDFHPIFKGQESLPWVQNPPPLKMGPIGYPKMSVKNYYYMLHNSPEEHSSQVVALL
jgi:hypothetical protein